MDNKVAQAIGDNIQVYIDQGILTLKIDLQQPGVMSASGKSMVIASTRGNQSVGDVTIGLNVYKKRTR